MEDEVKGASWSGLVLCLRMNHCTGSEIPSDVNHQFLLNLLAALALFVRAPNTLFTWPPHDHSLTHSLDRRSRVSRMRSSASASSASSSGRSFSSLSKRQKERQSRRKEGRKDACSPPPPPPPPLPPSAYTGVGEDAVLDLHGVTFRPRSTDLTTEERERERERGALALHVSTTVHKHTPAPRRAAPARPRLPRVKQQAVVGWSVLGSRAARRNRGRRRGEERDAKDAYP